MLRRWDDEIILKANNSSEEIANFSELNLRGRHNLENICAAISAAHVAGANIEVIRNVVKSFKGLEYRLELIAEIEGVKYYNDSFSTTPETAIAAMDSFDESIVLIAGGSDKGSDYGDMGRKIGEKVKAVFLIGDMADRIRMAIPAGSDTKIVEGFTTMDRLVHDAANIADKGDVVLLSPGCASFGLFENYKDRGNLFNEAVRSLD